MFTFACAGGDGIIRLWTVTVNPSAKSECEDQPDEGGGGGRGERDGFVKRQLL